jgi:hypothetical protein
MKNGILDIKNADKTREICICNNCENYYYDDLRYGDMETLVLFPDGTDFFYKGCPVCKTDSFLFDV